MKNTIDDKLNSETTEPSLKIVKISGKISNIMEKEKVKFTPERVKKCCMVMREQLATGKRIVIKKESLDLYNKNADAAPDSHEIKKSKDHLKKELFSESEKIVALSYELLQKGEIECKIHKYIADFFK